MPPTAADTARLEVAIRAAREGGRVALEYLGNPLHIRLKGRRDLGLGSAERVQDAILKVLRTELPDEAVLAEEGPDDEPLPIDAEKLWIVDPICGSINYYQRLPMYAVCLGFREGSSFRVGVVYDPSRDELFSATLGGGAHVNGEPINVHRPGEGEDVYEETLVGTDLSGQTEQRVHGLRVASHLASHLLGVHMLGSPALGLSYVAAGRLHAYFHYDLRLWDVAAAAVILQEAGGVLTDITGASWLFSRGGYLATNGALTGVLLRLIADADKDQSRLRRRDA
jgi:myo-inositol-1(or 4)-monophosphatase